jgi:pyruvate/2-oxoglutarate dehydrogenase complex dihydrolipoamide acyltransferase (E2) component
MANQQEVTIREPETPALAPDQQQPPVQQGESLLAGKFKTVEELEKAYQHSQRLISQRGQSTEEDAAAAPSPDEEDAAPEEEDQPEDQQQSAAEIYGEFIGGRLEEAGVDYADINTRWQQSGQLSDEDYSQLQQAGFNREMVDAYLSGLQYKAAQDSALTAQQIASIKAEYGGDAGYGKMLEWAGQNLKADEIEGFNQIVNGNRNLSAVKLAIAGLHSRYVAAVGREPKLIGGRAPRQTAERFESTAQVVEAMKDPRYAADPAYRAKVQEKLGRSSIF